MKRKRGKDKQTGRRKLAPSKGCNEGLVQKHKEPLASPEIQQQFPLVSLKINSMKWRSFLIGSRVVSFQNLLITTTLPIQSGGFMVSSLFEGVTTWLPISRSVLGPAYSWLSVAFLIPIPYYPTQEPCRVWTQRGKTPLHFLPPLSVNPHLWMDLRWKMLV